MANRRMLARNISTSVKVNRLTDFEALLYTWMVPWLDDYGQIEGEPEVIKAQIMPMRKTTDRKVGAALARMADLGLIVWHLTTGKIVIKQTQFEQFQTNLHKRTESKLPTCNNESIPITSQNFPEFLGFTDTRELNLTELKGTKEKITKAPLLGELDFETFWNTYPKRKGKRLGKPEAKIAFKKHVAFEQFDNLLAATENYAKSSYAETDHSKDAFRWLPKWQEWVEPETNNQDAAANYFAVQEKARTELTNE